MDSKKFSPDDDPFLALFRENAFTLLHFSACYHFHYLLPNVFYLNFSKLIFFREKRTNKREYIKVYNISFVDYINFYFLRTFNDVRKWRN